MKQKKPANRILSCIFFLGILVSSLVLQLPAGAQQRNTILVLDVSGSMQRNDSKKFGLEGLKLFTDLTFNQSQLSVLTFAEDVETVVPFRTVETMQDREEVFKKVDNISYDRRKTDILGAMKEALNKIPGDGASNVVLLTDGVQSHLDYGNEQEQRKLRDRLVEKFQEREIPVYCIAFTDDADWEFLKPIFRRTRAEGMKVMKPEELLTAFSGFAAHSSGNWTKTVTLASDTIQDFSLPAYLKTKPRLLFMKNRDEPSTQIVEDTNASRKSGHYYDLFQFKNPVRQFRIKNPGDNTRAGFLISPVPFRPSVEEFSRYVPFESDQSFQLGLFRRGGKEPYDIKSGIKENITISVTISRGDNTTQHYLYNDGTHGDKKAGDHLWSIDPGTSWSTPPGERKISYNLEMKGLGTRNITRVVNVLNMKPDHQPLPAAFWNNEDSSLKLGAWAVNDKGETIKDKLYRNKASVKAVFQNRQGKEKVFRLYDDGSHGDREANDGKFERNLTSLSDINGTWTCTYTYHLPVIRNSDNSQYIEGWLDTDRQQEIDIGKITSEPGKKSYVERGKKSSQIYFDYHSKFGKPRNYNVSLKKISLSSGDISPSNIEVVSDQFTAKPGSHTKKLTLKRSGNKTWPGGEYDIALQMKPDGGKTAVKMISVSGINMHVESWVIDWMPTMLGGILFLIFAGAGIYLIQPDFSGEYLELQGKQNEEYVLNEGDLDGMFKAVIREPEVSIHLAFYASGTRFSKSYEMEFQEVSGNKTRKVKLNGVSMRPGERRTLNAGATIKIIDQGRGKSESYVFRVSEI